ncbi:ABC transporter permease [Nocardioides anomalus]|uniref:ABC transporter permease n=1 Tax=Nocardioides anomalus TaxID=2712223 RepID=A0A6G6W9Y5_9ACTN|nr:ABC transporter permease [Nocardioides anomalus]QIG41967.1 ABC transporter permease [Nocardioides anomalus]
MSTTLDLSATSRVPFTRLVAVELRKARDTRAGFWLLAGILAIVVVVLGILVGLTLGYTDPVALGDYVAVAAYLMSFLLPFLAIMLVTSEWSQRSALVTFSLEPRRSRVVLAKLGAALLLTVANLIAALVVGLVCTLVCELAQPDLTSWRLGAGDVAGFLVTQSLAMVGGFAIATLLLNTPASIVLFVVYRFVLPGVFAALSALSDWFGSLAPWLDFQAAQGDIYEWELSGAEAWGHLLTSGALWLALPLAVGLWRVLRAEVK